MSDYISRQAAIEAVDECTKLKITDDFYTVYTEDMKDMITDIPAADVRENVRGEWIFDGKRHRGGIKWCHCSVCGYEENADYAIVQGVKFCPNCGADMRGEA